jgi:hypothetical protein
MRVRRFAPAFLLLAVVAGLFMMHTIGHLGTHAGMSHVAAMPAAMTHDHADLPPSAALVADLDPAVVARPGGAPGLPGDLMALCVAILAAVATIAVAMILLRHRRAVPAGQRTLARCLAIGSRAPPWPGIGLRLADLSVLRN